MKQIISFLILLIVGTTFQGCKKSDNPVDNSKNTVQNAAPTIPLAIGNQWTYSRKVYNSNGNLIFTGSYYIQIIRDTTIQNHKWYIQEEDTSLQSATWIFKAVNNQADGFYYWDTELKLAVLLYKYPSTQNLSYNIPVKFRDTTMYKVSTVASINSSVTVSAGQFLCYKYSIPPTTFSYSTGGISYAYSIFGEDTYVSDKGIIKIQSIISPPFGSNYVGESTELTNFTLK